MTDDVEIGTDWPTYHTKRGKPINLNMVEYWASRHLSIENMAALLKISRGSIYELIDENKQFEQDFYDAIESGKAQAAQIVTNKLLELCEEGHPQSIYFYLERKGGWTKTETVKNEHTGKDGTALQAPVFNIVGVAPKDES
jgi:predicted DNA-binding protein YlxM (UPF0122 family)